MQKPAAPRFPRLSLCIVHSALCIAFVASAAFANWQPGLKWGYLSGSWSTTKPAVTYAADGTDFALQPLANHGWGVVYWGQMYFDGSQYRFCGHIDDYFRIKVDGATVAQCSTACGYAFGNVTPSQGWHDVEFWLYNDTSANPSGPTSNSSLCFNSTNGFCFTKNDTTSTTADGYIPLSRLYAGDILRYDDLVYENDSLVVDADPPETGRQIPMTPSYGGHLDMVAGSNYTCTAALGPTYLADTLRLTCTGYVLTVTDTVVANGTSNVLSRTTGSTNTFSYTHDGHRGDLVWLFDDEVLCTFNASSGGSLLVDGAATTPSRWFDRRSIHMVTAIAENGYDFAYMTVDGVQAEGATIALDCTEPHIVVASFLLSAGSADKVYVGATDGDWDTASNWDPAGVPTVSDDVYIPAGKRVMVPLSANVHSLTVSNNAAVSVFGATSAYIASGTAASSVIASGGSVGGILGRMAADYTTTTQIGLQSVGDVTLLGSGQLIVGGFAQACRTHVGVGGDLSLSGTAKMAVYAGPTNGVSRAAGGGEVEVAGTATIGAGTTLELLCHIGKSGLSGRGSAVVLDFGDTVVEAGGKIVSPVGSSGYCEAACRPGAGSQYNGAGHGGKGGKGGNTSVNVAGAKAYGNALAPLLPGSYGREHVSFGGGIVRLKTGALTLNGTISASATTTRTKNWESGGSSGGAVWITCDSFSLGQSATLSADGCAGFNYNNKYCGGGAGGRIALGVRLTDAQVASLEATGTAEGLSTASLASMYPANVSVAGKAGVLLGERGEDGTAMYCANVPEGKVSLTIAVDGPALDYSASPAPGVQLLDEDAPVSATVASHIVLDANDSDRLFCMGWTLASSASGTVLASGSGNTCSYAALGENAILTWTFQEHYRLVCTACGDGTVSGNVGEWVLPGTAVSLSATPSEGAAFQAWATPFFLSKTEIATPSLSFRMDAPLSVFAVFDTGRTLAAKTWSGASGGDWDTASNWTPAGVPTPDDAVTIPAGSTVSVSRMAAAGSLTLGNGANLSIFGAVTDFFKSITTAGLTYSSTTAGGRNAASVTATAPLTLAVADDFTLAPSASVSLGGSGQACPSTLYVGGGLSLQNGARLAIYPGRTSGGSVTSSTCGARAFVLGATTIATNATVFSHGQLPSLTGTKGDIAPTIWDIGALTVAAGGAIVSYTGNSQYGVDFGSTPQEGDAASKAKGAGGKFYGAGHGGVGGSGTSTAGPSAVANQTGGVAYDNPYAPLLPGRCGRYTMVGGGVVRIYATDVILDGTLDASATIRLNGYEAGGGSGGSVLLFADTFRSGPTARLVSRGMAGFPNSSQYKYNCGGGAGGRVAVVVGADAAAKAELLSTGDTTSKHVQRIDLLGEQTRYKGAVDVSGGDPSTKNTANYPSGADSNAATAGGEGTAWMLRFVRPKTVIFVL